MGKGRRSRIGIILVCLALALSLSVGLTACGNDGGSDSSGAVVKTKASGVYHNPLTGISGFDRAKVGKRPVAIVVENTPDARPQWGIDDPEYSPDIILEAEVEGGITRTLWFFADMDKLPERVGPLRSARPPFIEFSQLFDAIYVHIGMSHSAGHYYGADSLFEDRKIDHLDGIYGSKNGLFDQDKTRNVAIEHTSFLYGIKLPAELKEKGFRMDAKKENYTKLPFIQGAKYHGQVFTPVQEINVTFSDHTNTRYWTWNESDGKFHTQDFATDVARDNLIILMDETKYWEVPGYMGVGVTYCDYLLAGGDAKIASQGQVVDVKWAVKDGKLEFTDAEGNKVWLPAGKSWIGWASSNEGGSVQVVEAAPAE